MSPSLSSVLLPKLKEHFADRSFRSAPGESPMAVFPCEHPDVGDIEIHDDVDELTVVLGNFTHTHFANYDDDASDSDKADKICESLIELLEAVFADRIELYGSHKGAGGFKRLGEKERGKLSRVFFGTKSFVWSGPLNDQT